MKNEISKNIGLNILTLRNERNLSIRNLSKMTGFSSAKISRIESGQSISIDDVIHLSKVLGIDYEVLISKGADYDSYLYEQELKSTLFNALYLDLYNESIDLLNELIKINSDVIEYEIILDLITDNIELTDKYFKDLTEKIFYTDIEIYVLLMYLSKKIQLEEIDINKTINILINIVLDQTITNKYINAKILLAIGKLYYSLENYDIAHIYFAKVEKINRIYNRNYLVEELYEFQGKTLLKLSRSKEAEIYFNKVLLENEYNGNKIKVKNTLEFIEKNDVKKNIIINKLISSKYLSVILFLVVSFSVLGSVVIVNHQIYEKYYIIGETIPSGYYNLSNIDEFEIIELPSGAKSNIVVKSNTEAVDIILIDESYIYLQEDLIIKSSSNIEKSEVK